MIVSALKKMNRSESCRVALRSEFKQALKLHRGIRAWHYGLNLSNTDHSSSLSTYLKLTRTEYEHLLVICGLAKKKKHQDSTRMEMEFGPWKEFLIEIEMGSNYFDKYQVNRVEQKKVMWLQLGNMYRTVEKTDGVDELDKHKKSKLNNRTTFTPRTQFKLYEAGAPRSRKTQLLLFAKRARAIIDVYYTKPDEDDVFAADDDDDDDDNDDDGDGDGDGDDKKKNKKENKKKNNHDDMADVRKQHNQSDNNNNDHEQIISMITKLSSDILKQNSSELISVVDKFVYTYNKYKYVEQQKRIQLITPQINDNNGNDNNTDNSEEIDMKSSAIPMLSSLGVPLTKNIISSLLRDIVCISNQHPMKELLSYTSHKGNKGIFTLVNTFRWKSKEACVKYSNQKKRRGWMKALPELVSAKGDDNEGAY